MFHFTGKSGRVIQLYGDRLSSRRYQDIRSQLVVGEKITFPLITELKAADFMWISVYKVGVEKELL